MSHEQLEGYWINAHIRSLLEERDSSSGSTVKKKGNGPIQEKGVDATEEALKASLEQARRMVQAAQKALDSYISIYDPDADFGSSGHIRRGVTSREMSGEMGGDTFSNSVHSVATSLA